MRISMQRLVVVVIIIVFW